MSRLYAFVGALLGLTAVGLSSYASHAMTDATDLRRVTIALAMQAIHALLLMVLATWVRPAGGLILHAAAVATIAGVALFCGSLHGAAFAGWPTSLAPFGGVLLMLGWLLAGIGALGLRR